MFKTVAKTVKEKRKEGLISEFRGSAKTGGRLRTNPLSLEEEVIKKKALERGLI